MSDREPVTTLEDLATLDDAVAAVRARLISAIMTNAVVGAFMNAVLEDAVLQTLGEALDDETLESQQ